MVLKCFYAIIVFYAKKNSKTFYELMIVIQVTIETPEVKECCGFNICVYIFYYLLHYRVIAYLYFPTLGNNI